VGAVAYKLELPSTAYHPPSLSCISIEGCGAGPFSGIANLTWWSLWPWGTTAFSAAAFHFPWRGGNSASVGSVVQLATGTN
jgi:hypothetical protein